MLTEDKLARTYRELPISELICISPRDYTDEAVKIAWNIIVERQNEVISFLQEMDPFELFSNIVAPDFARYNPATMIGIKQVFSGRKEEMLKQLRYMDEFFDVQQEMTKEMEESLSRNIAYPSNRRRYEAALASLREKKGWLAESVKGHIERALGKKAAKPPKNLDKDARELLKREVEVYKWRVTYWIQEIRPMVLELLGDVGSAPESRN